MNDTPWWEGPLAAFDTETTGVDVETDRIVTAHLDGRDWLIAPDIDIPAEATAIHGITTEHAREHGSWPETALQEIYADLVILADSGTPLVGHNVSYDLTLLDRAFRRLRTDGPSPVMVIPAHLQVVDSFVVDKHVEPRRRGKRTLAAAAERWGVTLTDAHDAAADANASVAIFRAIMRERDGLSATPAASTPYRLHNAQVRWRWEQQVSLQDYLRSSSDPEAVCRPEWPIIPR